MTSTSAQPACLRCRSRKTKCLGRTESTDCQSCMDVGIKCEVIPHQRGRKVGTRLSDSVRARLKRKRHKEAEERKAKRQITLISNDDHRQQVRVNGSSNNHIDPSISSTYPTTSTNRSQDPSSSYSVSRHTIRPTSSARVTSHQANPGLASVDARHTDYSDIGPSVRRTSSIARIFSDVDKDKERNSNSNSALSLWREDPITCGYINDDTAKDLFNLFMSKIAPNVYIFDQALHTYDYVQKTSSFLFCVILATAAKFSSNINGYTHKKCLALAKDQILRVFADDIKSEQTIQALFVLTEYKEAEDENAFLLLGMACRMAVDLDLSTLRSDYDQRRNRDRQRIWLALYAADKRFNYCGQTAKPSMMPEDNLIRSSENFIYSPICIPVDYRLASNVALRRVLSVSIEAIDKDNESGPGSYDLDLRSVYHTFEKDSEAWVKTQTERDPEIAIHANLSALHAKVIISHRWVQRSFRNLNSSGDPGIEENQERERREALAYCINGSLACLATMCELQDDLLRFTCGASLLQRAAVWMAHGNSADSKHLYFAYASFFLFKVFDTNIATTILDQQSLSYIFGLFQRSADKLERLAISTTHTIAFHAAFLRRLSRFDTGNPSNFGQSAQNPPVLDHGASIPQSIYNDVKAPPVINATSLVAEQSQTLQALSQPELGDPTFEFSSFDPLPELGNWLLENSTDESLGANINWNDWWPFDDDISWNFTNRNQDGIGLDNTHDTEWQGLVHSL